MKNYYIADGVKHKFEDEFLNLNTLNIKKLIVFSDKITEFYCYYNNLTKLELNTPNLKELYCGNNKLTKLELNTPNLKELHCGNNKLTKLELNTPNLEKLYCYYNNLTKLELNTPNLKELYCYYNKLTKLELNTPNLKELHCYYNKLTKLELNTPNLEKLYCGNNKLTKLELNTPNLERLYTDSKITLNGNPNIIGIDGCIEEVINEKQIDDFYIYGTTRGYVAKKDKFTAHGETLKRAIEDVNFKFLQETINLDELVSVIKTKGTLNMNEYRLLTGACSQMSKKFCDEHNIGYSDEVSLDVALQITKGRYGYEKFSELF